MPQPKQLYHSRSPSIYNFHVFKQFRYLKSPSKSTPSGPLGTKMPSEAKKLKTKSLSRPDPSKKVSARHRRRRVRSNSSFSSTASSNDAVDSTLNTTTSLPSASTNTNTNINATSTHVPKFQYHYNFNQSNKFDINNIVIPYDMMNNCRVVDMVRVQNVCTPRWRELDLDQTWVMKNRPNLKCCHLHLHLHWQCLIQCRAYFIMKKIG